ncbi:hypothetical protein BCU68_11260 [Vibrio sp. 10N.286.49.B3]|uniref:COG3014 family protein n=1 Tax=Vibrio sp. 10N.286.49.B3 TaxID=1880855 RepID=UPI000C85A27A|nr:hypothetical protein [Vibrio sp. 10N.286.49.B3]PMH45014.1 hypothetical protein BCU68_11260 [Vibrio sp. 10N.286.49.B3]
MKRCIKAFSVSILSVTLTACANLSAGNLFSHYSAQNAGVYQAVQQAQYQNALQDMPEEVSEAILGNLEKGRVYFLAQQYSSSKATFELSDQAVTEQQAKARVSVSDTVTSVGALTANDNIKEYQPADYELGFLHLYLGLNYLQENNLEGAVIEMRRANQVQEQAKQSREKQLQSAQDEAKKNGLSANVGSVLARYPDAGQSLQAVQNGSLMFLSGLLYEASRDLNAAYVDYRRALAVMPDNPQVIARTMYIAQRLGMSQDLAKLKASYGNHVEIARNTSRVIVFEEQSIVDAMQSWRIDLPIHDSRGNGAIYSLALPYYPQQARVAFTPMLLDGQVLPSQILTDVNLMAQQNLTERMPEMVLRQGLRVVAKDRIRKEVGKGDDISNVVLNIWNTLTEQPDTRSWQTLPRVINSASKAVKAGEHRIQVDNQSYTFNVPDGQTTLVWISRQGIKPTIWHKQLGRL